MHDTRYPVVFEPNLGTIMPSPTVPVTNRVPQIELVNKSLWTEFHKVTNEMVVNKPGRKMFPKIEISINGLDPKSNYFITLAMRPVDSCKYKFQSGTWSPAGQDIIPEWSNHVTHHEGPAASGEFWMRNPLSFDRVKLTNKPTGEGSQISLVSMHKYQPVISLYLVNGPSEPICMFQPKVLEFIAVTAYQSQEIINLKILHNPFAKGFREGSARKRSLSISPNSQDSSSCNSPPVKSFAIPNPAAAAAAAFFPVLPNFTNQQQSYYNPMLACYPIPVSFQSQHQYLLPDSTQNGHFNPYLNGLISRAQTTPAAAAAAVAMNAAFQNPSNQIMAALSNPATAAATLAMLTANPAANVAVSSALNPPTSITSNSNVFTEITTATQKHEENSEGAV